MKKHLRILKSKKVLYGLALFIVTLIGNQFDFSPSTQTMDGKDLVITRHGKCRMGCREIDLDEVRDAVSYTHLTLPTNREV